MEASLDVGTGVGFEKEDDRPSLIEVGPSAKAAQTREQKSVVQEIGGYRTLASEAYLSIAMAQRVVGTA